MTDKTPRYQTLKELLEDRQGIIKQMMTEPLMLGIDWSVSESHACVTLMQQLDGPHQPRFIIIDEIQPLVGEQVQKIMDSYGNKKLKDFVDCEFTMATLLDETPMIKKNGQMVRRHHPVPSTPRRFRK